LKSSLGKHSQTALNNNEIFEIKRKAWLNNEGLILSAAQIAKLDNEHQWAIEIIGNIIYGKGRYGKN
jgi:hypothetical protein